MRDLLDLLDNLQENKKKDPDAPDTIFAKGLTPKEIKKDQSRFVTLLQKIKSNQPFMDNVTGEEVYLDPSEAKRIEKLDKEGLFAGEKPFTVLTRDGNEILFSTLAKNEDFGGSSKESMLLKPSLIKITDKDIPATDLYEIIANNAILQKTEYGQVVLKLAQYIISGEHVQLPEEYLTKEKEKERKSIVDYAGEYLGVIALLYQRSRFPRKEKFIEWLGADMGQLILNFPSAANNNIADSYAIISNPTNSHSVNISSKGTGGGAAPAISGLKISDDVRRNPKLKNAVKLIELCQAGKDGSGPSTIVQAFKIMDFLYQTDPSSLPKEWQKILPFATKAPRLQQQCIDSINSAKGGQEPLQLAKVYQSLINDIKSDAATDGGKMVYKIKKVIAHQVNSKAAIPEFADTILQVLEMNFVQQYTDFNPNGELTFATQWPAKLEGVVTMENKSSAVEPSSAGFSFKLGRSADDYEDISPDGESSSNVGDSIGPDVSQAAGDITEPKKVIKLSNKPSGDIGRKKR
jgi:hypothetical protein